VYLGDHIEYKGEPYSLRKELEKKELLEHHAKMQDKPFSFRV